MPVATRISQFQMGISNYALPDLVLKPPLTTAMNLATAQKAKGRPIAKTITSHRSPKSWPIYAVVLAMKSEGKVMSDNIFLNQFLFVPI